MKKWRSSQTTTSRNISIMKQSIKNSLPYNVTFAGGIILFYIHF